MVRQYPDRVAVNTRTLAITYAELNTAANRVAQAILACRGDAPAPVALLFDKGIPLIATLLGALKAGKFYILLDPALPQARLAYILEDSQASLFLMNNEHLSLAQVLMPHGPHLLNIDALDTRLPAENPALALGPAALAYISYTSGSTGQPKGVIETHQNFLHAMRSQTNDFHICVHDRLLMLGAQAGVIFRGLLNGASVYPVDIKKDGLAHLATFLLQEEITLYHSVPSVFRHFVDTLTGEKQFPKLRVITLLGESVYKRDVELYQKYFAPPCIFVNSLGTTETENFCRYFLDHTTQITGSLVPAGYAIEDKTVLMLSDEGKEVDYNEIGEITVRSRFLSRGYWQKPDLTQAAFQAAVGDSEERIYRTGDLGVMQPDGCLVHLGRKDFQVKMRG
jgi:amino acid adenylation domain-containing protein